MIRDRMRSLRASLRSRLSNLPRIAWDASSNKIVFVKPDIVDDNERLTGHTTKHGDPSSQKSDDATRSAGSRSSVGRRNNR